MPSPTAEQKIADLKAQIEAHRGVLDVTRFRLNRAAMLT
jgi:hypothetical protein